MSEYPYAHVSSKLKDFLDKIPSTGIPGKVTYNELTARGFKSTNDRTILSVLKYLHLVDPEGIPTENWNLYRDRSNNKVLLASLIRNAYSDLFAMYPAAQERTEEEIRNFIASKTKVGEDSLSRIVTTFKTLSAMADFTMSDFIASEPLGATKIDECGTYQERNSDTSNNFVQETRLAPITVPIQSSLAPIHVNIHIHLPATDDLQVADTLIKSIARHIIGRMIEE